MKLLLILLSMPILNAEHSFMLGGWIPRWRSDKAINTVLDRAHIFDQVSPFSYEVTSKGKVWDTLRRFSKDWQELKSYCKEHKKQFVPTIYWTNTEEMHNVFSNKALREEHINSIMSMVTKHDHDGININYERVWKEDREHYLSFIKTLSERLHEKDKVLHISIGARTSDGTIAFVPKDKMPTSQPKPKKNTATKPPKHTNISLYPGEGESAQRYKRTLAECCDQIHIMGYDEWGKPFKHDPTQLKNKYYVSHASNQWISQSLEYMLTFVPPEKLVLGVPSYGLEFAVFGKDDNLWFKKRKSLTFSQAYERVASKNIKQHRSVGGEVCYTYDNNNEHRYVCYLDSLAMQEKVELVKRYHLKGMYIFTINGYEDPAMWPMLEKEQRYSLLKKPYSQLKVAHKETKKKLVSVS